MLTGKVHKQLHAFQGTFEFGPWMAPHPELCAIPTMRRRLAVDDAASHPFGFHLRGPLWVASAQFFCRIINEYESAIKDPSK